MTYPAESTLPKKTSSTASGLTPDRSTAPLMASEPSWVALRLESELGQSQRLELGSMASRRCIWAAKLRHMGYTDPRNEPTGVRAAETM